MFFNNIKPSPFRQLPKRGEAERRVEKSTKCSLSSKLLYMKCIEVKLEKSAKRSLNNKLSLCESAVRKEHEVLFE